jgi:hypothetical protein
VATHNLIGIKSGMLTPNDIHYLVGVLTQASTPEDVEIELGDFVYDEKAEEERDVDVTIKYRNSDNLISAFIGLEVKKHTRPLNTTHVEQLIKKLSDMKSITHRGIVSASGYYKPAMRKAKADGVDLFHLKSWPNPANTFDHIMFLDGMPLTEVSLEWVDPPFIHFTFAEHIAPEEISSITHDTCICDRNGNILPMCPDIRALGNIISNRIIKAEKDKIALNAVIYNQPFAVKKGYNIVEDTYMKINDKLWRVREAVISGHLVWRETVQKLDFKMLIKEGEAQPYIGCAVAELSNGDLVGFSASTFDRNLHLIRVLVSERNKSKLHRIKLK